MAEEKKAVKTEEVVVEATPIEAPKVEKKVDPTKQLKKELKAANDKIAELELAVKQKDDFIEALKSNLENAQRTIQNLILKFDKDIKFIANATNVFHQTVNRVLKENEND